MSMRFPLFALSLGCALLSACADEQASLIVLHAPLWPDDACAVDAGSTESLLRGILDIEQGTGYFMPAAVLNNLSPSTTANNAGIDTNEIQITGASVTLESSEAPELIDALAAIDDGLVDFSVPVASVSVIPGEIEGFILEVISPVATRALRDLVPAQFGPEGRPIVVARAVFHGLRSGGNVGKLGMIDSREFAFPIELCQNCLLDCSTCADAELGSCPASYEPGEFIGGTCGNAQDGRIAPVGCELPE